MKVGVIFIYERMRQSIRFFILSILVQSVVFSSYAQWVQKSQGLNGGNILSLIESNGSILAGTSGAGIFSSNDNGSTWTRSSNGLPRQPVITSMVKIGTTIFSGLYFDGVYK